MKCLLEVWEGNKMNKLIFENLDENEFVELLSVLPRDILTAPFVSSPKRFSEYVKGFRPANIPDFKIRVAYNKLVFGKEDLKLTDYINDNLEEYMKKYIDERIDEELLIRLKSLNYSNNDLSELVSIFFENQIKISVLLYLKIREINLTEESISNINAEIIERQKQKDVASKIENKLKAKYDDLLKKKITRQKTFLNKQKIK